MAAIAMFPLSKPASVPRILPVFAKFCPRGRICWQKQGCLCDARNALFARSGFCRGKTRPAKRVEHPTCAGRCGVQVEGNFNTERTLMRSGFAGEVRPAKEWDTPSAWADVALRLKAASTSNAPPAQSGFAKQIWPAKRLERLACAGGFGWEGIFMPKFSAMSLAELTRPGGYDCACGKRHAVDLPWLRIERGALNKLPEALAAVGAKHPFVVCDGNTYQAAGARVGTDTAGAAGQAFPPSPFLPRNRAQQKWRRPHVVIADKRAASPQPAALRAKRACARRRAAAGSSTRSVHPNDHPLKRGKIHGI